MLWHAPWAGRAWLEQARVVDAFAGTGALGFEALSRGASFATFIECDRAALASIAANVKLLAEETRSRVLAADACAPPRADRAANLVFLDPPYGQALVPRAVAALAAAGWLAPGALLVAELGRDEALELPGAETLAERAHGAARLMVWRLIR
jgi:16S rRNA (guanine966-N2)-methyltransferase